MVDIKDITYSYGKKQVLLGASLSAEKGQCVGIAGANGCGKSTFLSILSGSRKPRDGKIYYFDQDALQVKKAFSTFIGYVPQENPLIEELSVKDNLKLWFQSKSNMDKALKSGILVDLKLPELLKLPVSHLSGGQKKRVSIGCAVASNPPILILDEPGAALDLVCKAQIMTYLRHYLSLGGTAIIATHEESELDLCSKLYVMYTGRLYEKSRDLRGDALISAFFNEEKE